MSPTRLLASSMMRMTSLVSTSTRSVSRLSSASSWSSRVSAVAASRRQPAGRAGPHQLVAQLLDLAAQRVSSALMSASFCVPSGANAGARQGQHRPPAPGQTSARPAPPPDRGRSLAHQTPAPPVTTVTARRFCAPAALVVAGRHRPLAAVGDDRDAGCPGCPGSPCSSGPRWPGSTPSAMLYSPVPRSSAWPSIRIGAAAFCFSQPICARQDADRLGAERRLVDREEHPVADVAARQRAAAPSAPRRPSSPPSAPVRAAVARRRGTVTSLLRAQPAAASARREQRQRCDPPHLSSVPFLSASSQLSSPDHDGSEAKPSVGTCLRFRPVMSTE